MNALELIDELESELNARPGLFSKKIDIDKCMDLLSDLKEELIAEIKETNYVLGKKREILLNADLVAKNTIKEAEERATLSASSHELIKRAETQADGIIENAYQKGEVIIKKTKEHLDVMFRDVEEFLLSNLTMIRKNRDELRRAALNDLEKSR